jgi:carboxylesterase
MIWDFADAVSRRLLLWSALSVLAGALLLAFGDAFWRGFGLQALVWGVVDAAIAILGRRAAEKRRLANLGRPSIFEREARNLRRLLWINTGLDVLYVAGGIVLIYTLGAADPFARGNGWGIVIQGGFLFLFDLLHALAVPKEQPALPPFAAFNGPEHQPFRLEGGQPAALLLHGFLGTPAEMRSLGEALHDEGWTVHAPLLPGFGADIGTLLERRHEEWVLAAECAAQDLVGKGHAPLVVVGYSMGAALALMIAARAQPKALALLAPFSWPEPRWLPPVEFLVRPFLPTGFTPMRKASFDSPEMRGGMAKFMPGVDLDDPAVQAAIRDFRVPLGLIDQIRAVSGKAQAAAASVKAPVLVIQGKRDTVARAAQTEALIRLLPKKPLFVLVDSEHNLTEPSNPAWPEVRDAALDFVRYTR